MWLEPTLTVSDSRGRETGYAQRQPSKHSDGSLTWRRDRTAPGWWRLRYRSTTRGCCRSASAECPSPWLGARMKRANGYRRHKSERSAQADRCSVRAPGQNPGTSCKGGTPGQARSVRRAQWWRPCRGERGHAYTLIRFEQDAFPGSAAEPLQRSMRPSFWKHSGGSWRVAPSRQRITQGHAVARRCSATASPLAR